MLLLNHADRGVAPTSVALFILIGILGAGCPDGSPFEAEVPAEPNAVDDDDATDTPDDDDAATSDDDDDATSDDDDATGNDDDATSDDDDATSDDDDATSDDQPPSTPVISISPAVPGTLDDLALVFDAHSEDPEGAEVTYTIRWLRDSTPIESLGGGDLTPANETAKGQTWQVEVTASDGLLSSHTALAEVLVVNSPPIVDSMTITPTRVQSNGEATCAISWTDPDEDDATVELSWTVDGIDAQHNDWVLDSDSFEREDELVCLATVTDTDGAAGEGEADASVVANTPPGPPVVHVDDPFNDVEFDLLCEVVTESEDFEEDPIEYTFQWLLDGQPTAYTEAVLPASATSFSENWSCVATPFDGFDAGTPSAPYGLTTCDGVVYYEDNDDDGFGDPLLDLLACVQPPSTSTLPHDCDDNDEEVYPEAGDTVGDGVDQDCDGRDCESASDGTTYFTACGFEADWETAQDLCRFASLMYDGLARLTTQDELDFVTELVAGAEFEDFGGLWLGLSDADAEGDWQWWDGTPATMTSWMPESPENETGDEDCGQVLLTGEEAGAWIASDCSDSQSLDAGFTGYICEMR